MKKEYIAVMTYSHRLSARDGLLYVDGLPAGRIPIIPGVPSATIRAACSMVRDWKVSVTLTRNDRDVWVATPDKPVTEIPLTFKP